MAKIFQPLFGSGKAVAAGTSSAVVDFTAVVNKTVNAMVINNTLATGYPAFISVSYDATDPVASATGFFIPGNASNLIVPLRKVPKKIAAIRQNGANDGAFHVIMGTLQESALL